MASPSPATGPSPWTHRPEQWARPSAPPVTPPSPPSCLHTLCHPAAPLHLHAFPVPLLRSQGGAGPAWVGQDCGVRAGLHFPVTWAPQLIRDLGVRVKHLSFPTCRFANRVLCSFSSSAPPAARRAEPITSHTHPSARSPPTFQAPLQRLLGRDQRGKRSQLARKERQRAREWSAPEETGPVEGRGLPIHRPARLRTGGVAAQRVQQRRSGPGVPHAPPGHLQPRAASTAAAAVSRRAAAQTAEASSCKDWAGCSSGQTAQQQTGRGPWARSRSPRCPPQRCRGQCHRSPPSPTTWTA